MSGSTVSAWDDFFKIWAILGPLIVAIIGAIWSRSREKERLQVERIREKERLEIEHTHAKELLELAKFEKLQDVENTKHENKYKEVREALVSFMASSTEYVRMQGEYIGIQTPEAHLAAMRANEKFINSYQLLILLGNQRLAEAATNLWNKSIFMPLSCAVNVPRDDTYKKELAEYQLARTTFNQIAQEFLCSIEQGF